MKKDEKKDKAGQSQDKATETALAKQGPSAVAELDDFEDEAGAGFEENDSSMVKIPFINILQPSSKIIKTPKKQRAAQHVDAEAGMIHNNVTDELYDGDKGLEILPVFFRKVWTLWAPDMGGFKGKYDPQHAKVKKALAEGEFGQYKIGDDDLIETIELYVVYASPVSGELHCGVLNIASTKITAFKDWNSRVSGLKLDGKNGKYTPPLYCNRTLMRSEFDPGKNDNSFFRLVLEPAVQVNGVPDYKSSIVRKTDPRYTVAKKFHQDLLDMKVSADYSTTERGAGGGGGDARGDDGF